MLLFVFVFCLFLFELVCFVGGLVVVYVFV